MVGTMAPAVRAEEEAPVGNGVELVQEEVRPPVTHDEVRPPAAALRSRRSLRYMTHEMKRSTGMQALSAA